MCGEKSRAQLEHRSIGGSPPHVRGKAMSFHTLLLWSGDHPRMCGEKRFEPLFCGLLRGSPPHVRGKDIVHPFHRLEPGITPACAGKSAYVAACKRL